MGWPKRERRAPPVTAEPSIDAVPQGETFAFASFTATALVLLVSTVVLLIVVRLRHRLSRGRRDAQAVPATPPFAHQTQISGLGIPSSHTLKRLRDQLHEQRAANSPAAIVTLTELGTQLEAQGRLAEAEHLHREALTAKRDLLGPRHPDVLVAAGILGSLLQDQGRLEEAEALYRETLQARRETLGDRHPVTLLSMNNLGAVLQAMGRLDEAAQLMREGLGASRSVLGSRHPETLVSINNFGVLELERGNERGARLLFQEAVEGARAVLGEGHPDTVQYEEWLSRVPASVGRSKPQRSVGQRVDSSVGSSVGPSADSSVGEAPSHQGALDFGIVAEPADDAVPDIPAWVVRTHRPY